MIYLYANLIVILFIPGQFFVHTESTVLDNGKLQKLVCEFENYTNSFDDAVNYQNDISGNKTLDILILSDPSSTYFGPSNQAPAFCAALSYVDSAFTNLSGFEIRVFFLAKSESDTDNYRNLLNVFRESRFSFIGVLGPDLEDDKEAIWLASRELFTENPDDDESKEDSDASDKNGSESNQEAEVGNKLVGLNTISYSHQHGPTNSQDSAKNANSSFYFSTRFDLKNMNKMYMKLFHAYNWNRVVILYEPSVFYFLETAMNLGDLLSNKGSDFTLQPVNSDEVYLNQYSVVNDIAKLGPKGRNFRIFILFLNDKAASKVLCQFYLNNMYGDNYLIFGQVYWDIGSLVKYNPQCNTQFYQQVMNYSLYVSMSGFSFDPNYSETNLEISVSEYETEVQNWFPKDTNVSGSKIAHFYDSGLASDALWVLLSAADSTLSKMENKSNSFFAYQKTFASQMWESLKVTNLNGASGNIQFDSFGHRKGSEQLAIYQRRNNELYLAAKAKLPAQIIENNIQFSSNITPSDQVVQILPLHIVITDLLILVPAILGFSFCSFAMLVFLIFRKKPGIKLLSPKLNFVCGLGCLVVFSTIIAHVLVNGNRKVTRETAQKWQEREFSWSCSLYFMLTTTGFFLSLSTLVAKMFKVHQIFGVKKSQKPLNDRILIIMICSATALKAVLNFMSNILPSSCYETMAYVEDSSAKDIQLSERLFVVCEPPLNFMVIPSYVFVVFVVGMGIYFSWTTRKVRISFLNDSQKLSMLILISTVLYLIQRATFYLFNSDQNSRSTLLLFFISTQDALLVQWIIALQVFLPGLIRLVRDPNWKPNTSINPPSLQYTREMQKCLEDVHNIHNINQILNMYIKTTEMWTEIIQAEKEANGIEDRKNEDAKDDAAIQMRKLKEASFDGERSNTNTSRASTFEEQHQE